MNQERKVELSKDVIATLYHLGINYREKDVIKLVKDLMDREGDIDAYFPQSSVISNGNVLVHNHRLSSDFKEIFNKLEHGGLDRDVYIEKLKDIEVLIGKMIVSTLKNVREEDYDLIASMFTYNVHLPFKVRAKPIRINYYDERFKYMYLNYEFLQIEVKDYVDFHTTGELEISISKELVDKINSSLATVSTRSKETQTYANEIKRLSHELKFINDLYLGEAVVLMVDPEIEFVEYRGRKYAKKHVLNEFNDTVKKTKGVIVTDNYFIYDIFMLDSFDSYYVNTSGDVFQVHRETFTKTFLGSLNVE